MAVKVRSRKLSDGSFSFYLDIYFNGQRAFEPLKIRAKTPQERKDAKLLAENIRAKRELELQSDDYQLSPLFKRKMNFIDYIENLAKKKKDKGWTSLKNHISTFTKGQIEFRQINHHWIESFKDYMLSKVSENSLSQYFTMFKTALNTAIREGIIRNNPFNSISSIKKVEKDRVFLTFEEVQTLSKTDCSNDEIKRAFLFSCYTGLRYSDIEKLTSKDILGDKLQIRVKKTSSIEHIPLGKQALRLLQGDKVISIDKVFKLPTLQSIDLMLKRWASKAGIDKHVSFHVARHTFATLCLSNGVDIYTVSKLLGHKDLSTTQIYAKIIDEKKVEAVNRLPEIGVI